MLIYVLRRLLVALSVVLTVSVVSFLPVSYTHLTLPTKA